jgi:uncharacterized protein (DUF608 family)
VERCGNYEQTRHGYYGQLHQRMRPVLWFYTNRIRRKHSKALIGLFLQLTIPDRRQCCTQSRTSRFASAEFDAAYPFAVVKLEDNEMPISAKAKVFNPYIPGDPVSSGIPVAVIRYEIKNKTSQPITVAVAGSLIILSAWMAPSSNSIRLTGL